MAEPGIKRSSTLAICTTPQASDLTASQYAALTWVPIGSIVTMPDFGVTDNIVSQDYVNTDVSQKRKGFRMASDTEIVVGRDHDDLGQDALRAAAATRLNYAFRMQSSDGTPTLTPTTRYSRGIVGGPNFTGGGGEDFDNETFQLGLNQAPVIVEPTAIP
jgi:hypothetical protein